jgi:hypothetical protein
VERIKIYYKADAAATVSLMSRTKGQETGSDLNDASDALASYLLSVIGLSTKHSLR